MAIDYDMGTGRNELMYRITHEKESDDLIAEIEKCEDVNYSDKYRYTYLHFAAQSHQVGVIKALLERGANPNALDNRGAVPILAAIGRKNDSNAEILKLFLQHGMDLNILIHGKTLKAAIEEFEDDKYNAIIAEYL